MDTEDQSYCLRQGYTERAQRLCYDSSQNQKDISDTLVTLIIDTPVDSIAYIGDFKQKFERDLSRIMKIPVNITDIQTVNRNRSATVNVYSTEYQTATRGESIEDILSDLRSHISLFCNHTDFGGTSILAVRPFINRNLDDRVGVIPTDPNSVLIYGLTMVGCVAMIAGVIVGLIYIRIRVKMMKKTVIA